MVEGRNTSSTSAELTQNKRGIGGMAGVLAGVPVIPSLPYGKRSSTGVEIKSDTASVSAINSSQGGVRVQGGSVYLQGVQLDAARDLNIHGGKVAIRGAVNRSSVAGTSSRRTSGIEPGQILWHDPSTGINARKTIRTQVEDSSLTRTTLHGANVHITAADTLAMAGTTVNTPGTLSLQADKLILGAQTTEHKEQTTRQGRDLAYQKNKDTGTQDQATHYVQVKVGNLAVNANRIQADLGARDSVEELARQPGMGWVNQLTNDPALSSKVDWTRVEEVHKHWNYSQQGLTPEGAALVTLVISYLTWGAAQGIGAAVGDAAAASAGQGIVVEGATFAAGSSVGAVAGGAVTAGVTALASQASVALINNQGDIGAALHDLGRNASVKTLLMATITGGVLGGLNMNPTGLPTVGGGSQQFFTQLGQNLQAGAARALIGTAINGGSLEQSLSDGLKNAILDTVAAQAANEIGNLTKTEGVLNDFTNKVAHAVAGCMVGAARADNTGGCGAGALGAAIGEFAAESYGRQADTVQFAAMVSGLAVAITGGDASQITLGSQAGANAAANNYLNHDEAALRERLKDKRRNGKALTAAEQTTLDNLEITDIARDLAFRNACKTPGDACDAARRSLSTALNTYVGAGAMTDPRLSASGNAAVTAERNQGLALANDPNLAAQSLLDSFNEFAVPQLAGYAIAGALGAYINEARAIYGGLKVEASEAVPVVVNLGSTGRLGELVALFDKQVVAQEISLAGKAYTATAEGNKAGTTKVFNTTNLSNAELEIEVKAYVNELTGGVSLAPVAGSPTNVWAVTMKDGTIVNLRSVSSSQVGNTGRSARWTVDIKNNPLLEPLAARDRIEIKFK